MSLVGMSLVGVALALIGLAADRRGVAGLAVGTTAADGPLRLLAFRLQPAVALVHPALEGVELRRTGLDAHALGDRAPALAGMAVVVADDLAAGTVEHLRQRAGVVDVAGRPAAVLVQLAHVFARRAVVGIHVVVEIVRVAAAVGIDFTQARVEPDVTRARAVVQGNRLGLGAGREGERSGQGEQEDGLLHGGHLLRGLT